MVGVTIVAEKVRMAVTFGIEDARVIARRAHGGQNDLAGHPYSEHVEAGGAGLVVGWGAWASEGGWWES